MLDPLYKVNSIKYDTNWMSVIIKGWVRYGMAWAKIYPSVLHVVRPNNYLMHPKNNLFHSTCQLFPPIYLIENKINFSRFSDVIFFRFWRNLYWFKQIHFALFDILHWIFFFDNLTYLQNLVFQTEQFLYTSLALAIWYASQTNLNYFGLVTSNLRNRCLGKYFKNDIR